MQNLLENLPKIPIISNFWKILPETPGIYVYFNNEKVIYIGKAINLKRRVTSYFDLDLEPKTARMINEANFISHIKVDSELSALLLEARLIRKYMPHYNIAAKDDKRPLYITITDDKFPRIITTRKSGTYGPFPSTQNVYSVLRLIRRIFPFSDHKLGKRACLYSHIGLCNPCPNVATNNLIYLKNIKNIKKILDGDINKVKNNLVKEMKNYSSNQEFEKALEVKIKIEKLEYITSPQMPTDVYMENPNLYEDQRNLEIKSLKKIINIKNLHRIECYDISHLAGVKATASMVTFINGTAEKSKYRHFKIKQTNSQSDYDSMEEIARRRSNHFTDPVSGHGAGWGKPDLIIVDGGKGQVTAFKKEIFDIPIIGIAKHPDRLIIGNEKIKLEGPALNLVSRIRDEAHRFARRLHHKLISKSISLEHKFLSE